MAVFNTKKNDAQATAVEPVSVSNFSFEAYQEYESQLSGNCSAFMDRDSGVLVYRRMRVAEVFSYGCRNPKQSLEWQLGALQASMDYPADVPNFLEPWYGIGAVAAAFGIDYVWNPGQAPAVIPQFASIDDALAFNWKPVSETGPGRHTLDMIEYFLDQTKGRLPMSFSDIQSPFNNATSIVDTSSFLLATILEPEKVLALLNLLADLEISFYREQEKLIGGLLVKPGHGFASSHFFEGFGMSDDNVVMVDEEKYIELAKPSFEKLGKAFGGPVMHSCGNFSDKTGMLGKIDGLKMVDAAFTAETDPDPNPAEPFREALAGSGIILNARMVGNPETVRQTLAEMWKPGMKIIAVTYSQTPQEQKQVYEMIHAMSH